MSALQASNPFPRAPLRAMAGLVAASVLGVAAVRITGIGAVPTPEAPSVQVRELRFEDRPDGSIAVLDATANRPVQTVAPGTNGFLRGTMRGLARERRRQGAGTDIPFRLVGHADGTLTLEDPATGRRVDLRSFGPTNAAVFAQIMASPSDATRSPTP